MIGENIEILRSSFTASKEAGKTWQIWAGATSKYVFPFHYIYFDGFMALSFFVPSNRSVGAPYRPESKRSN